MKTPKATSSGRFGTFGGVFTPCTLTILGVIMFLRFGQVVGGSGILHACAIVLSAKLVTTITSLSLSAIATNTRVRGGGAYYLISRSLGIEFGGSIGIVFFLSQALSVAMYVIGFTEALVSVMPAAGEYPRVVATVVNAIVCVCVLIGAGWTIKVQYVILAALGAAILAFFAGALDKVSVGNISANLYSDYPHDRSWLTEFALFFPAATGIMAGANMSGDLANPGRAIPRGTLAAIGVTAVVYLAFAFLLGAAVPREELLTNNMVVRDTAIWPWLIIVGVFAATLSSALGSMMGAPRILQALARDRVLQVLRPFARGHGPANEPRSATVATFVIAEAGILLGNLNAVAPIITMFFMVTYGALNLATFTEAVSGNPSYRPTFRWCHWSVSLLGAVLCVGAMILIDATWAAVSVLMMAGIYEYLNRQDIQSNWGDVHHGAAFERARRNLMSLEQERYHPKNWRPAILALGAGNEERLHLAAYTRWLSGPRGLLILGQVIIGEPETFLERQASHHRVLRRFIGEYGLEAFPAVTVSPRLSAGVSSLVQCCGIGALRPNLVALGFSESPERRADFGSVIRTVHRLGRSLALLRIIEDASDPWTPPPGPIDVWWRGRDNGELMLLLAHQLRRNEGFTGRKIRILRLLPSEARGAAEPEAHLVALSQNARIPAEPRILFGDAFLPVLQRESKDSAVVILGFPIPKDDDGGAFVDGLERMSRGLPHVLLVNSAGDMNLHD